MARFRNKPKGIDTLAVDADIIAYRCAAVHDDDLEIDVFKEIDDFIYTIARDTEITKMCMFLSPKKNFRYDVATTRPYKETRHRCAYWQNKVRGGKRTCVLRKRCKWAPNFFGSECKDYYTSSPRPKHIAAAKEYIKEMYNAVMFPNYEADDTIASYITKYKNAAHAGMDKDIKQVEGWHYDFVKKEWEYTDVEDSVLKLYRQVCTGDSTDSIVGIPKIGPKKAEEAIQSAITAESDAELMFFMNSKAIFKQLELTDRKISNRAKKAEVDDETWKRNRLLEYYKEQYTLIAMVTDLRIPYSRFVVIDPPPICDDMSEDGDFEGFEETKTEFINNL